jgi:hypothetical protein
MNHLTKLFNASDLELSLDKATGLIYSTFAHHLKGRQREGGGVISGEELTCRHPKGQRKGLQYKRGSVSPAIIKLNCYSLQPASLQQWRKL